MGYTNTAEETAFFDAVRKADRLRIDAALRANPSLISALDYQEFGGTPLNIAASRGYIEVVLTLLASGADPNLTSDWAAGPWNALQIALSSGHDEVATLLVKHGARLGPHELAGLGRIEDLATLLKQQPDAYKESGGDGCTPLHFAANAETVDVLLDAGANIEARDIDHYSTPLHYLARPRPAAARRLIERGAQHDLFSAIVCGAREAVEEHIAKDSSWQHQRITNDAYPAPSDGSIPGACNILHYSVGYQATPLHAAVKSCDLEMIDLLAEHGIDINLRGDYDECTAMHMAAWHDNVAAAERLLKYGAEIDMNSGDLHSNTPLGWAIIAGSPNMAHWLIRRGAEIRTYFEDDAIAARNLEFMGWRPGATHQNYHLVADLVLAQS